MNEPVELPEIKREAAKLLQFEANLWSADIAADNKHISLERLVKLAEDAIDLAREEKEEAQSLFTFYFDETRSREYFSSKEGYHCRDQNGNRMNLQPKTFVEWNLNTFSAHEVINTLYTVVFGRENGECHYRDNPYAVRGFAGRSMDESLLPGSVRSYLNSRPRPKKNALGNDVASSNNGSIF